jgi:glycine/D-amino acid oxidase-like deaminating enzyme
MVHGKAFSETPLIVGQGLAGTCLAWEFLRRGVPFRIADRGVGGSTRVAAGLINPITGKNFEPSWRIAEFYPQAIAFYRSLEEEFGETLWHPLPVLRLASSEKEWAKISAKLDLPEVAAVKRAFLRAASSRRLLVDVSKFRPRAFMTVCGIADFHQVVTDDALPRAEVEAVHAAGVALLQVSSSGARP